MDNRTLVTTEDVVVSFDGRSFRVRRIPHYLNEQRIMWLVEVADDYGHFWPLAPQHMQTTHGLYRWAAPGSERRRED